MLSKNRKKLIKGLSQKKIRRSEGLFVAEGDKLLKELLGTSPGDSQGFRIHSIVATREWLEENRDGISGPCEVIETTFGELRQVSSQQTPDRALAIVRIPDQQWESATIRRGLSIGLYRLQDPGNMGTIIRIADWFGIRSVICSADSADLYNPKVIRASMGSFLRVRVYHRDLQETLAELKAGPDYRVYATVREGDDLFRSRVAGPGLLLMGNESQGLEPGLLRLADSRLSIPWHDPGSHAESLNVAVAAAIFCAEFRRQGV